MISAIFSSKHNHRGEFDLIMLKTSNALYIVDRRYANTVIYVIISDRTCFNSQGVAINDARTILSGNLQNDK